MNKNISRIAYFACSLIILFGVLSSCSGCSNDRNVVFPTVSNHEDSVRVFNKSKEFMDRLRAGDVDGAIDLLYVVKNDTAYKISPELRKSYTDQFKQFPVKEYEVKTSDFSVANKQTITYRYRFMDNPTDDPNYPIYVDFSLGMEYHQGDWRLVLNNQKIIQ